MNLTNSDISRLSELGITKETIEKQFENLVNGPDDLDLNGPCVLDDGITAIPESEHQNRVELFKKLSKGKTLSMFTPASGAATRMFKHLINPKADTSLFKEFTSNIKKFAFSKEIENQEFESVNDQVEFVLQPTGLNYAKLPKAMISFHEYENNGSKAIDDQLLEGLNYLIQRNTAKFHFTISPEHESIVTKHVDSVIPALEEIHQVKIEVTYSFQEKYTDTIALSLEGELVRDELGELLLRPGGHGALIHNLNAIDTDIVFIKNIDNIARKEHHEHVAKFKMIIGSELLSFQEQIFAFLNELENELAPQRLTEIANWVLDKLGLTIEPSVTSLKEALNKPIRVCGMVKNEGKAGGGPFWVGNSAQIVESAQMNTARPEVKSMLEKASHFNPVDIVCGIRNYNGEKFDLLRYTDESTFFVSDKSYLGKDIKVLEHPGLWNGAMANWLTLFVEVPVTTFNPVKTVNDLLLPQHCVK